MEQETGFIKENLKEVEERIFPPREVQNQFAQPSETKEMGNATIVTLFSALMLGSIILLGTILFFIKV